MRICKVEGCSGKYLAKGYCGKHYRQLANHGKIFKRTIYTPNEIIIKGDIAEIVLYNKKCQEIARATIDAEDVERVKKYKWSLTKYGYAQTREGGIYLRMQHVVMGVHPNRKRYIDHNNRDPLFNRKTNLRFCTHRQNQMNCKKRNNNTSGFKGVCGVGGKWRASIRVNGKTLSLGTFKKALDAARSYNAGAIKFFGEFACINEGV